MVLHSPSREGCLDDDLKSPSLLRPVTCLDILRNRRYLTIDGNFMMTDRKYIVVVSIVCSCAVGMSVHDTSSAVN